VLNSMDCSICCSVSGCDAGPLVPACRVPCARMGSGCAGCPAAALAWAPAATAGGVLPLGAPARCACWACC
jgi:hypothetical protein